MNKPLFTTEPMQAFVAGALHGLLLRHGDALGLGNVVPGNVAPTGFEIQLPSGLRLAVKVEVLAHAEVQP